MTDQPNAPLLAIGLVGTFDVDNYGDCLFPEVYAALIRARLPGARFTLYSPYAKPARILSFDSVKALPATLDEAQFPEDCLILIGGETVSAGHVSGTYIMPGNTMSHYLRMWLGPTVAATRSEVKFFVHSAGLRLSDPEEGLLIGRLLESADAVSMRDAVSVERLGGQFPIEVDPVFLLQDIMAPAQWSARARAMLPAGLEPGNYLAVQASHAYFGSELDEWCAQIARVLEDTGQKALFLPVCHFMEDQRFLQVAAVRFRQSYPGLADRIFLLPEDRQNVKDTAALIGCSAGYCGTSLHGAVTAAAFALPMATYSGAGKEIGKHAQTLLAAGIDTGVFHRIGDLADCFRRSAQSPLEASRTRARAMAEQGVDRLCARIAAPKEHLRAPSAADLVAIREIDMRPLGSTRVVLKRKVLSAMRRWPAAYEFYRQLKLQRRFSR